MKQFISIVQFKVCMKVEDIDLLVVGRPGGRDTNMKTHEAYERPQL